MAEFVHLHVHSQFSLLDGALKVKELAGRAKALGMRAVALTDHGNMFGAIQFYKACQAAGVAPILGCEVNVARRRSNGAGRAEDVALDHLVLLATSERGYKNLVRIVSAGHVTPAAESGPSIELETVARYREGIVGLTGCMGGVVAQRILEEGETEGRSTLERLRECFEPGSLYVELQDHGLVEQPVLNESLIKAARELGLPLVATNDTHFGGREDGEASLYLSCIAANRLYSDTLERHHGSSEMFLKAPDEMEHLFRHQPGAVTSTLEIAERCAGLELRLGEPMLPTFVVPDGYDAEGYFRHVSREGLERRFAEARQRGQAVADEQSYRERLETELDVIVKMSFAGYFLIVWDFIRFAKDNGIPVGPGRGSGAGSLAAYALRITDLDPIRYSLLFERFLNPERVSMPDFDIDFCMDRRDQVIAYVADLYGKDSVGQIATFHELKARSVIKDVGRAMAFPATEAQKIASLIPQKAPGVMYTIPEALQIEPKLKAMVETDPTVAELLKQAQRIEGLTRHAGMHAAGVVISEGPLWDHVPCFKNDEQIVTQYDKDDVEAAGLVKFDFLGLKTLTVIDIAIKLVNARPDHGAAKRFDIDSLPLGDSDTYALMQSGETTGVFQLESSGMQQLFKDLRPDAFEDVVAAVALYRPGPLGSGMVKDFVDCKHKRKPIARMHDLVDDLLLPTYGVVVYQEQVMQIAQRLAGYTLGGADLLRRAMGKKKPEEMAKQKVTFVKGAEDNGVKTEDAERIFGLLEFFAGYGFNKCLVGETRLVEATTGEATTVEDLVENPRPFSVHAVGPDGRLRERRVVDVLSNGRKKVFEVRTAQGKRIVATANHPFLTLEGWRDLGDLGVGDRIGAPRRLDIGTNESWPEHELIVLAGLLSEGNTCHPSCLYFFGKERLLVEDFARAASVFPNTVARTYERRGGQLEVCLSTGMDARFKKGARPWNARNTSIDGSLALAAPPAPRRCGAREWAERLGVVGRRATEKSIPAAVFRLRDEDLEIFVGRLWAGDGFIANETQAVPFYATSSKELARDVQSLMLRLGIQSGVHRKTFKYATGRRVGFTVHVLGEGSVERFVERITPHCVGRDRQVDLLRRHLASTLRGRTSEDTIPADVRRLVDEERRTAGLTWRELERRAGVSTKELLGRGSAKKKGFRRATIARLGEFFQSARLSQLASSDVFWDRIVAIEPRGIQATYDLTIDVDHNFVADGLIVHNSHSAAYALLTYQTAYLKTHFPVEYLSALMTADRDKIDKVVRIIAEGRAWGVDILPPEINESQTNFTVVYATGPTNGALAPKSATQRIAKRTAYRRKDPLDPKIRFGLGAIRGVGEAALEAILEARASGGPFADIFDFAERIDARRVNKAVLESLVQCGAFDASLAKRGISRARAYAAVERALERSKAASKDRETGQTSLFGLMAPAGPAAGARLDDYPEAEEWDLRQALVREKQSLGFYVSGHPLDRYGGELARFEVEATTALAAKEPWSRVRVAGMVEGYRERIFRGGGGKAAFFTLEDTRGRVEVKVRQNQIETYASVLTSGEPVIVSGKVSFPNVDEASEDFDAAPREPTLLLDEAVPLADAIRSETRNVQIKLVGKRTGRDKLVELASVLRGSPGPCPVQLVIQLDDGAEAVLALSKDLRVEPGDAMLGKLERLFGEKVADLR